MKIDEITRNSFLAPLFCIDDTSPFDDDGEYNGDEYDFWNIYNPDAMDIPDADKKDLAYHRKRIRECGDQYRKDVEQFLAVVSDQDTLRAVADMVSSLDDFSCMYSGIMQYSETLAQISVLEQTQTILEKTISELEPLAKEHPEIMKRICELKDQCARLKEKRRKQPYGYIRMCYVTFKSMYKGKREVSERVFENWCKGIHAPDSFPKDWYNALKLAEFAGTYDRGEKSDARRNTFPLLDKDIYEDSLK